jgi:hypothetical protein
VTKDTKKVDGITSRVIHDVVTKDDKLIERAYDWYAQDSAGNPWYLGEDTKAYENGTREAEDRARILGFDEKVKVPFGRFDNVLMTEDTAPWRRGSWSTSTTPGEWDPL